MANDEEDLESELKRKFGPDWQEQLDAEVAERDAAWRQRMKETIIIALTSVFAPLLLPYLSYRSAALGSPRAFLERPQVLRP